MNLSDRASYIRQEILKRNLGFCKDITPEQMEVIASLSYEYESQLNEKDSLLKIELQDENSIPKVFHKGKEITGRKDIKLHWETDDAFLGGLTYRLEYVDEGVVKVTERRTRGHM